MKNWKRIIAYITAAVVFAAAPVSAHAESEPVQPRNQERAEVKYGSYTGTVVEIYESEGNTTYTVEKDGELAANIIANENTYILGAESIQKGDIIEGYYDINQPMLMIYPPQISAVIIAVNPPELQTIKIDRFDGELLSWDDELKLNISTETDIVLQDGTKFDGELTNRLLAVVHSFATLSLPAQTSPTKIIVLYEKVAPVVTLPIEKPEETLNGEIVVEGVKIEAPKPYVNQSGVVMVPIRAVAEKLGYTVTWEENTQSIWLNVIISLSIGKDYYTYARTAPIELGTAPELTGSHTYVPLSFFKGVMRMPNAYVFEGQIIINNGQDVQ